MFEEMKKSEVRGIGSYDDPKTIVLLGRRGNGKSATGNSIIGANAFDTIITNSASCQLHSTFLYNVIDTPGFTGSSFAPKIIDECINIAKDGIHAFLVVVKDITRFSLREASAIESLKQVFGSNIGDYMIVVFTHGDALPKMNLDEFLGLGCPEQLVKILKMCGNRRVLFDNVTKDDVKKSQQRNELLRLVDSVVDNNGGIPFTPFTNELFAHSAEVSEHGEKFYEEAYEDQLKLFIEKSEVKLRERTLGLEKQLADEQVARILAETKAQEVQTKSSFVIDMLKKDLDKARREAEYLRETNRETEALLKKTKEKFKETEEIFKETEHKFAETNEKFKETKEIFKKMEHNFVNYEEGYMCVIL